MLASQTIYKNNNSIKNKSDLNSYLKELHNLKNEKNVLKYELDSSQSGLNEENLNVDNVKRIFNLYSAQISNLNDRHENIENAVCQLLRTTDLQQSIFQIEDSMFVKNMAARLAKTIEMYEDLSKRLKESEAKLEKYERQDKQSKQNLLEHKHASQTTYLNTSKLICKLKKFIKLNKVKRSTFAHRVLGTSKMEFLRLISKATPWMCCKPRKRSMFIRIRTFLNDSNEKTELLNYLLVERLHINAIENANHDELQAEPLDIHANSNKNFVYNQIDENFDYDVDDINEINDNEHEHVELQSEQESLEIKEEFDVHESSIVNEDFEDECGDDECAPDAQSLSSQNQTLTLNSFGKSINIEQLCAKTQTFLNEHGLSNTKFAHDILQLSRRSFTRLLHNKINWNNCKPTTRGYLSRLDAFLSNKSEMNNYVCSLANSQTYTFRPCEEVEPLNETPNTYVDETNLDQSVYPDELNIDREDLSKRSRKFLEKYGLNYAFVGQNLFGISRRSFNRLCNDVAVSWQNCKPNTRERLVKLKNFLDDEAGQRDFLSKFSINKKESYNGVHNVRAHESDDDDDHMEHSSTSSPPTPIVPLKQSYANQSVVDVKHVSKQIYKFLQTHKISQRTFAQKVLGLTKNRFNKLICKPPSWHSCKSTTKQSYIQIEAFLKDQKRIKDFLGSVLNDRQNEYDMKKANLSMNSFNLTTINSSKLMDREEDCDEEEEGENDDEEDENDHDNDDELEENEMVVDQISTKKVENDPFAVLPLDEGCYTNLDLNMNTFELAKQVEQFLKLKKVNENYFASKVLNIDTRLFTRLVYKPEAWNRLQKSDRIYYIKLKLFLSDLAKINLFLNSYQSYLKSM